RIKAIHPVIEVIRRIRSHTMGDIGAAGHLPGTDQSQQRLSNLWILDGPVPKPLDYMIKVPGRQTLHLKARDVQAPPSAGTVHFDVALERAYPQRSIQRTRISVAQQDAEVMLKQLLA